MKTKERALESYLVVRVQAGDRRAMTRLIELRGARLMAHAMRMLGEVETARDVVQDAWIEIIRSLAGLRAPGAFLPWALRIVTRQVAQVISKRQKNRSLISDFTAEAELSVPEAGPAVVDGAAVRRAAVPLIPSRRSGTRWSMRVLKCRAASGAARVQSGRRVEAPPR